MVNQIISKDDNEKGFRSSFILVIGDIVVADVWRNSFPISM